MIKETDMVEGCTSLNSPGCLRPPYLHIKKQEGGPERGAAPYLPFIARALPIHTNETRSTYLPAILFASETAPLTKPRFLHLSVRTSVLAVGIPILAVPQAAVVIPGRVIRILIRQI